MNQRTSELVVEIAKRFSEYALAVTGDWWDEAFLRCEGPSGHFKVTSIYRQAERSALFMSDTDLETHSALAKQFSELNRELTKKSARNSSLPCFGSTPNTTR